MSKQITRRDFCNGIAIGTGMNFMGPMNFFGQIAFASQDLMNDLCFILVE